jgi:predicted deacetylase
VSPRAATIQARRLSRATDPRDALAVTIHDVEPATWERAALLRDWLRDLGVRRATLLVVPAPDLHAFDRRCPALQGWLEDCVDAGDEVAQHGFRRTVVHRPQASRSHRAPTEFVGLDAGETARAVDAGRRILAEAGIPARGFVAPRFAYTPELRAALASRFAWWASADALHASRAAEPLRSRAIGFASASAAGRGGWPPLVRVSSRVLRGPVRLELHPGDVEHPGRIAAAESVLRRHVHRRTLTCGELVAC